MLTKKPSMYALSLEISSTSLLTSSHSSSKFLTGIKKKILLMKISRLPLALTKLFLPMLRNLQRPSEELSSNEHGNHRYLKESFLHLPYPSQFATKS